MLDVFFLPNSERAPNSDIQTFVGAGTNVGSSPNIVDVHEWKKPRGITMAHILCIGAGGGGGGGVSATAGTSKAGGAGGGSGSLSTLLIPAIYLPDKLYVLPGNGGIGGAAGVNGTTGSTSMVLVYPDSNFIADNLLINSSNSGSAAANGGTAGVTTTGGTGGSGMPASTAAQARWSQFGLYNSFTGSGGSAQNNGGNAGANGPNFNYVSGNAFIMPGTGGGGTTSGTPNTSGGIISFSSQILGPVAEAKSSAAGPGSVNGSGGYVLRSPIMPFFIYGGLGGGGADASIGGNGGHGIWGSGGGGGGAGTTGGNGGDGGSGVVIITCW